ncbi:uncharacterized protein EKO05_0005714 [Ascochyta rabiei]|nr:uncharacterized protein EKO05_0005714 [Ascochyta rabiei]UPX15259.1 hypothetical protein EKO05_0005714 [Ascochyta rabiei]
MTIFADKAALMALGLEAVRPSSALVYQDCYICKNPLQVNLRTAGPSYDAYHPAVRVVACGHMHGQACLEAWLDTGSSCPTCRKKLFDTPGYSVSQADIKSVVRKLGRLVSIERVRSSIARVMSKQELERAQLRRTREREQLQKAKEKKARSYQDDLMDDDEWLDSGEEDFDNGEDGDSDSVLEEDDKESQSPTA